MAHVCCGVGADSAFACVVEVLLLLDVDDGVVDAWAPPLVFLALAIVLVLVVVVVVDPLAWPSLMSLLLLEGGAC